MIHVDDNAHLYCDFVPLTKRGNLMAKDVIGDKENAGRKKFLEVNKKGSFALNLYVWSRESTI